MTREQYLRMDKRVFALISVAMLYSIVISVFEVSQLAAGVKGYIQLAGCIALTVVEVVGFLIMKGRRICGSIMTGAGALAFLLIMSLDESSRIYIFAFPILIASIMYMNKRFAIFGSSVMLIANIIKTVREAAEGSLTLQTGSFRWVITILVCVGVYVVMCEFERFNKDTVINAESTGNAQAEIAQKMNATADAIINNFEQANLVLESLKKSIDTNNLAINNIADSTESTSQAIQEQANMCAAIQENSDKADKETTKVIELAKAAMENVEAGVQLMTDLKEQAAGVESTSRETADATTRLTNKVSEVQNIVGDIQKISSQTNLLALNASIEAARAGEAGRGFAVVADEIRELSEQTKEATNKIIGIIAELTADAKNASESMDNSVASINRQTEMIDVTEQKFEMIDSKVSELTESIHNMEKTITDIVQATGIISESISQLSATSEEVAASSEDGTKTAQDAVEQMEECSKVLENIRALSLSLKGAGEEV